MNIIINNTISHINIEHIIVSKASLQALYFHLKTRPWQSMARSLGSPSEGSGDPASPHSPLMQCPVSAHLHLFVGVHNHTACYKARQRDCIMVPLLKLCNLLSNTFDLLMKSKVAWCEHVYAPMHVNILVLKCYIYYI